MRAASCVLLALVLALVLTVGADAKGAERAVHLLDKAFWIWSDRDVGYWRAGDVGGEVTFTRDYRIAGKVESAVLRVSADSKYALFINGKEVGSDDRWQTLDTYDVRPYLVQGNNKFLVKARGKGLFVAGAVDFADGRGLENISSVRVRKTRQSRWTYLFHVIVRNQALGLILIHWARLLLCLPPSIV